MAIKITATNVQEFERIEQQVKLIGNDELIKKFSRADTSYAGFLTFHADDFISNDKLTFPRTVSINRLEFASSERLKAYTTTGEMETIYSVRILTTVTPENATEENVDKQFEAIFNAWSRKSTFEIGTMRRA